MSTPTRPQLNAEKSLGGYTQRHARKLYIGELGNNSGVVDDTARTTSGQDFVFVRLNQDANQVVSALAATSFPHIADIIVVLELVERKGAPFYQVLGIAPNVVYSTAVATWSGSPGEHANQHERRDRGAGGFDPLDVYTRALVNLRARAQVTPDLTLHVERGFYIFTSVKEYAGGDSAAFVPPVAASSQRWDLLYLGSDDALHITTGVATSGFGTPTYPACPADAIPLAYVMLRTAQTSILEADITDARVLWTANSPGGAPLGWFNVMDYGAVGDGTANDTTAVQAAITAAHVAGGGVVWFPKGTYLCDPLTSYIDVSLWGAGMRVSVIKARSAGTLITVNPGSLDCMQGTIRDLKLDGNTGTGTVGLDLETVYGWHLERVFIYLFSSIGLKLRGSIIGQTYGCAFTNCGTGVDADTGGGVSSNLNKFLDTFINQNVTYGMYYKGGAGICLDGCDIESNGTAGNAGTGSIYFKSGSDADPIGIKLTNCWFEATNGKACVLIDTPATTNLYHIVEDTQFIATISSTYGIYAEGASAVNKVICRNVEFRVDAVTADFYANGANATIERHYCSGTTGGAGTINSYPPFSSTHNVLSATHGDALTGSVVDGDVIIGNATPKWSRLAISVPAANVRNVLGIDNGELRPSWKSSVVSVNKNGGATLYGAVTLSEGANITLTQTGQDIEIASTGGGAALTVEEADGAPSVANVDTIIVPNGSLTDNGGGSVTFTPAGTGDVVGPAGATTEHVALFDGATGKLLKDGGALTTGSAGELGYTAITSSFTSKSLTYVDVTSLSVTVTVGSRPIKITVYSGLLDSHSVNGGRIILNIYDVTGSAEVQWGVVMNYNGNGNALCMVARVNPASGSRTYKVQMKDDGSAVNCRVYASATDPTFILVEEI